MRSADFVEGELLVRFDAARAAVSATAAEALAAVDGRVVQRLDRVVPGLQRVALGEDVNVLDAMADLETRGDVLYAEPNYRIVANATPNDSRFDELWGLHDKGQVVEGVAGTVDADIDAPEAWNVTTGSAEVTVAVLDSGVAYDHPDLARNVWVNSREVADNGLDDDGNGFVDDQLATFSNWSSTSVDVAAPGVSTLSTWPFSPVFFDDFETPTDGRWIMGGTPNTWGRTTSVPAYGATSTWLTDSPAVFYPDSSDNWARTTTLDLSGTTACVVHFNGVFDVESYFDFARLEAAQSTDGPWTEIGSFTGYWPAPDEVLEAYLPATFDGASSAYLRFRLNPDEHYDGDGAYVDNVQVDCGGRYSSASFDDASGTSMATPHVSGVAALVLARNPGFTTAQLRTRLLTSVDVKTSLQGKVATGGRINAYKAVR